MIERERKYLALTGLMEILSYLGFKKIEQHYFVMGDREVRVRSTDGYQHEVTMKATISEDSRGEITLHIHGFQAVEILKYCTAPGIIKHRYKKDGWEIDIYLGHLSGLITVERELTVNENMPEFPDWLAPHIVKDVTDDARYKNAALVQFGIPE